MLTEEEQGAGMKKEERMKKLMIIDDDTSFLEEVSEALKEDGYDVITVSESTQALKIAIEKKPDIILLDLNMEGMSGFQLADELRNNKNTMDIPIIGVTGFYTEREHGLFMRVCGIRECLIKPVDPKLMTAAIEKVLKKKR